MSQTATVQIGVRLNHLGGNPGASFMQVSLGTATVHNVFKRTICGNPVVVSTHQFTHAARDMNTARFEHAAQRRRPPKEWVAILIPREDARLIRV